jgi:hypothetical protein
MRSSLGVIVRPRAAVTPSTHREHRSVRADAQRKGEYGNERESGIAPQHAQGETHVLEGRIERVQHVGVARLLFGQRRVPELLLCLLTRISRVHAGGAVVFSAHFDVRFQLRVDLAV